MTELAAETSFWMLVRSELNVFVMKVLSCVAVSHVVECDAVADAPLVQHQ